MTPLQRLAGVLRQRQRWLLIALLGVLHLALLAEGDRAFGALCWLVDVGLFILWQPFIYAERRLDFSALAVIAVALGCGIAFYGWWLLIVWVVILAALVGGRVMFTDHRPTRTFYLIAFAYLLAVLLFWLVPRVVANAALVGPSLDREFAWGMPLFLVVMTLLPLSRDSDRPGSAMVDLFYSLFIFLLIAVLVLGSLAFMLLRQSGYFEAVFNSLTSIALLLLLIGWTWNTRPGFTGIDVFFSRYLLTIGLPFENWLHRLTTLASSESDPDKFLSQALAEMLDLPWVEGGTWTAGTRSGAFGSESQHFRQDFSGQPLCLTLHTRHKLSPALVWHFHLLAQLANEHYIAKLRARELQQVSYLRAIHETGARLTHDVKNLLQSLNNLCYLAQTATGEDSKRLELLLERQLPQITQRLQQTLAKLQRPHSEAGGALPAAMWWKIQQQRYAGLPVSFAAANLDPEVLVPTALFDSVADNLLQNALLKRQSESELRIEIALTADASLLSVCDSGSAIREEVLADLLRAPLASENGLGIGLYHAARQAESGGHELRLACNEPGKVCFELRRAGPGTEARSEGNQESRAGDDSAAPPVR
ncbi:MAG: putative PEP-CTERM system histidine kinase [Candidatus Accumulibacter appositus]|uniref:Putative PEP-CTERM system histidine kinase n=1 Tax=Candidatus Accumulibacter appositus TaxID=1454003 RepID=A0A011PY01_9PROT|nr:ATP-binding protein [Accumulibacter sp.]EXI81857.1 MAG: putative PEP-CTERM system histidine kinase [Candidatus Accumulibacter appositus]HRF04331.1 ATP-binding protein [Accumulibacter sp.]